MTKWKRLKKLREQKRFEAEALRPKAEREEAKQTEPEKISKNIQQSQKIKKLDNNNHAMYVEYTWDRWTYAVKYLERPGYPNTSKHFEKSNGKPDVHDADSKKDAVK